MRGLRVVLLGIAIAAAICGTGEARSRYHHRHHSPSGAPARVEPEGPMDPNRWCTGGFPITDDQQIRGCTALINLRRDRELRATAYYNRANAYFSKGDLSNAINDYGEALQIKPQYVEALNNRAVAYRASKNYASAIADYSQVLMISPHDVAALTGRGTALGWSGNNERAINDLTLAITIGARDVTARLQRGHAYIGCNTGPRRWPITTKCSAPRHRTRKLISDEPARRPTPATSGRECGFDASLSDRSGHP